MIKIGMIIGDRYEILEKIGTGGMSDVYKAKCHKLNRFVAVKVLKQEFSENANFVSKFRVEAQAAAGLMHPNIVNVYDVGEENGVYYIVMELVDGLTLKKYIEKKARLSYKEAVSIAIQVSMGIEAAHNNHIIHRDIKPQNIIISKEGKVKVTDFGIAKAATSNTITSNVMGSVHYTSPEQARGGYSDEKSDIYSLGITMFEMLTGRVPFNGETTVAIAIKHIQEEMPSPKEFVPEIPSSVEQIVLKCCQKSPDRRYQTMGELIDDLKQSLISPDEDFVVMSNPDTEAATRFISDTEMERIKHHSDRRDYMDEELRNTGDLSYEDDEEYPEDEFDDNYNPKFERITTILTVVAGLVICCIIIYFVGRITGMFGMTPNNSSIDTETESSTVSEMIEMIAVSGMSVAEAREQLTELGFVVELTYVESEAYEQNEVISADITAGTKVQVGSTVTLTVSAGMEGRDVPNVVGRSYDDAANELKQSGFTVNKTESYSSTVEKGNVISQSPSAGEKAPAGSVITVNVSLGEEETKIRVPDLMGLPEDEAIAKIIEEGLAVGGTSQGYSSEYEAGYVCYQSYSYGSYVDPGTAVDIRVSMGPETLNYTYRYNASIEAPTLEEAPDYVAGTTVQITIVTDDGKSLLDFSTASFPSPVNIYGITSSKGQIGFSYTVTTESTTTVNEAGETVVIPGEVVTRNFTRTVEFVRE